MSRYMGEELNRAESDERELPGEPAAKFRLDFHRVFNGSFGQPPRR